MSGTFHIDQETGKIFTCIPLASEQASTFHSSYFMLDKAASAANPIEDATDELEWLNIIRNPGVQRKLYHLAAEARQQYYAGEVEEGGFGVE